MIKMASAVTPSALVSSAGAALADPADSWGDGFGHMMWGGGFGMAGGLMMLLFWGAIIALIVFAVRGSRPGLALAANRTRPRFFASAMTKVKSTKRSTSATRRNSNFDAKATLSMPTEL